MAQWAGTANPSPIMTLVSSSSVIVADSSSKHQDNDTEASATKLGISLYGHR
ncbi:hypothetical protein ACPOL_2171 [Acidisarcina polymorpha]|uniref:Uncharacterized protein n=1 Tax=Acidisarcina polymorpha TaxID=2211140 RepID=A0A2Z5FYK4_9BACT|nr:hypothetical protein ACPOL_2171 [Acidisarcina polymorpha]